MLPLIALLAAIWWPGTPDRNHAGGTPVPPLVPAPDQPCSITAPLLTILVMDDSPSIQRENDPQNFRYPEARLLADYTRDHGCHTDDRIGVVQFASRARATLAPAPVRSRDGVKRIHAALKDSQGALGDSTELAPAVEEVRTMLRAFPDHRPTVVLFTDGLVGTGPLGADTDEALADVGRLPVGSAHLVAVGPDYVRVSRQWENPAVGLASVHPLQQVTRGAVARALIDIFLEKTRRQA